MSRLVSSWRAPVLGALVAAALAFAAVDSTAATTRPAAPPSVAEALHATLEASPTFPGVAAVVRAPGLDWQAAVGVADRASGARLTPDTPFRIASVTKTFTAAAVLRLVEAGRLRLADPIGRHLGRASSRALRTDGYDPDAITVRMLLQHTGGLYDYATDAAYRRAVASHPRHRWTRLEQVRFAMAHGSKLAEPGTLFRYSDTGYILLGEILERASRLPAARAYRALLRLDALGLDRTYLESLERPRGPERAHQYLEGVDAFGFDPSFDLYGGGGLVSTLPDLARFFDALLSGRVLGRPSSLAAMRGAPTPRRLGDLGLGLFALRLGDETCYGHQGFWGTNVTVCPRSEITIATTVNQAQAFEQASNALHARLYELARRARA